MAKNKEITPPEANKVQEVIALLSSFSQQEAINFLVQWSNDIDLYNVIHGVAMPQPEPEPENE